DPRRGLPELPRPRHPAAHAVPWPYALREPQLPAALALGVGVLRPGHPRRVAGVQPLRRRTSRPARPHPAGRLAGTALWRRRLGGAPPGPGRPLPPRSPSAAQRTPRGRSAASLHSAIEWISCTPTPTFTVGTPFWLSTFVADPPIDLTSRGAMPCRAATAARRLTGSASSESS